MKDKDKFVLEPQDNGIYWVRFWHKGYRQMRKKSLRTRNLKEAERKRREMEKKEALGISYITAMPEKGRKRFSEVLEECYKWAKIRGSIERYKYVKKYFIEVSGDKPISQYDAKSWYDFIEFCNGKKFSNGTIVAYNSTLKKIFQYAVDLDYIEKSPIKKYKRKKNDNEIKAMSIDLYKEFMEFVKERSEKYHFYFEHTYKLALRPSEALYLDWSFVDVKKEEVRIRNSKEDRYDIIPMIYDVKEFYNGLERKSAGKIHEDISEYHTVQMFFNNAAKAFMTEKRKIFDYTMYAFRKSRASHLADAGVDIYALSKFMRHESVSVTEKYYAKPDRTLLKERINGALKTSRRTSR
jgi:integrase/recombinase XerD